MPDLGIEVVGLRPFVRTLGTASSDLPKHMRRSLRKVAEVGAERSRAAMATRPGQGPTTARTIKAGSTQASAFIRFGGNPTAMGDEFGSIRYKQFSPWRGNGADAGYAVYPSTRAITQSGELDRLALDAVDEAVKTAFPD